MLSLRHSSWSLPANKPRFMAWKMTKFIKFMFV
jgi:hypothetical protein